MTETTESLKEMCKAFLADKDARISDLVEEVKRLKKLIEYDRTGLAQGLAQVIKALDSHFWLTMEDGWGSYEYDQQTTQTLRTEFADCMDSAREIAVLALRKSGDRVREAFQPQAEKPK